MFGKRLSPLYALTLRILVSRNSITHLKCCDSLRVDLAHLVCFQQGTNTLDVCENAGSLLIIYHCQQLQAWVWDGGI